MLVPLGADFTLWSPDWEGDFRGVISRRDPVLVQNAPTAAVLRPALAVNRFVTRGTDPVDGWPWALAAPLAQPVG